MDEGDWFDLVHRTTDWQGGRGVEGIKSKYVFTFYCFCFLMCTTFVASGKQGTLVHKRDYGLFRTLSDRKRPNCGLELMSPGIILAYVYSSLAAQSGWTECTNYFLWNSGFSSGVSELELIRKSAVKRPELKVD